MPFNILIVMPLAFVCEFIDSSLGMGYGTILAPLLILLGFQPLQIVPAVLFSEFVTGLTSAFFHHSVQNVNFKPHTTDTKVVIILSIFSVIGVVAAVIFTVRLPPYILKFWIGAIVVSMGIFILATYRRAPRFTWRKIMAVGALASFNKGLSGGGYGPLVMGGQMLSGIGVKNAVGIASLAESMTCLVGIVTYSLVQPNVDWRLAPWLMCGAVLSVPLAVRALKILPEKKAKVIIAILILILGSLTLWKAFAKS